MPVGGNRMGFGAPGPSKAPKYKKPKKGTKTVSAMKPSSRRKRKR